MKRGSITPFCALVLMLTASLLFALLESGRVYVLDAYAALKAECGMDSLTAEYQPFLWQQYGLLFLDGAYGAEEFSMNYVSEELEKQIKESLDTYSFSDCEVYLEGYALATDIDGKLFLNYIAEREKENLPFGMAEDVYELYCQREELEQEYGGVEENMKKAQSVFSDIKEEWQQNINAWKRSDSTKSEKELEVTAPDTSVIENTWNTVRQIQQSNLLNTIFCDLSEVSQKNSKLPSKIETRKKEIGTMNVLIEDDWYQKLLVLSYLEDYFSNYTEKERGHVLDYEIEYVLCGKESEWENLEGTLRRILLVREAANMAYLMQDTKKMAAAEAIASFVGILAGENPAAVKVIQIGILSAWAYLESILDVRSLIAGEAIPFIKQEEEWTTEAGNILSVFDKNTKAKVCKTGLKYVDYLKQLLFIMENETLAYRMMEVMEIGMQSQEEYQNCKMNHMLVMLKYEIFFETKPFFQSFITIGRMYDGNLFFSKKVERSYIP